MERDREEILNRVREYKTIWNTIKEKEGTGWQIYLKHGGLAQLILEGKTARGGRPTSTYTTEIVKDVKGTNSCRKVKDLSTERQGGEPILRL